MVAPINSINFNGRWFRYSTHTPTMRPYKYAEYQPELQTKNQIKEFFKDLSKALKSIFSIEKAEPTATKKDHHWRRV